MNRCPAITKKGICCKNRSSTFWGFCGVHKRVLPKDMTNQIIEFVIRDKPLTVCLLDRENSVKLRKHILSPLFVLHGKNLGNGYVYCSSFLDWWNMKHVEKWVMGRYGHLGFSSGGKLSIQNNNLYKSFQPKLWRMERITFITIDSC